MKKFYLSLLTILYLSTANIFANKISKTDIDILNNYKHTNNLTAWLEHRLEFTQKAPSENLGFLMNTQAESWRSPKTESEKITWLYLLINQGYYQLYHGDIMQSIDKYEEAYLYHKKQHFSTDINEDILKPLSNNYTRIGDYDRALHIQNKALEQALKNKNDTLAASIYNNLAATYRSKGDLKNAENHIYKGIKISNESNSIFGLLYSALAEIQFQKKDYSSALSNNLKAINLLKSKKETTYWLLGAYSNISEIYFQTKQFNQADLYASKGIELIEKNYAGARKRELANLYIIKAKINSQKANFSLANNYTNKALSTLLPKYSPKSIKDLPLEKDLFAENRLQLALEEKAEILKNTGDNESALQSLILALEVSEKLRTEYTYTSSKNNIQVNTKQLAEKIIDLSYTLFLKTKNPKYSKDILFIAEKTKSRLLYDELAERQLHFAEGNKKYADILKTEKTIAFYKKQQQNNNYSKKINDLTFKLSSLKKELKLKNFEFNISADDLLAKIPANSTAIVMFCGVNNLYILNCEKGKIINITKTENATNIYKNINHFLNTYYHNGPTEMMNKPKEFYLSSNKIYETIFKNINLKNTKNLIVIKDDVFNFLSFDGLISNSKYIINTKKWDYLIKQKNISYYFSLNAINNSSSLKMSKEHHFFGFFITKPTEESVELQAVLTEYNNLKNSLEGTYFKNERSTHQNFTEALNRSNILHISTHAYLDKENKEPVLELYNEKFHLFELAKQKNIPEMVVLSACQTADGKFVIGEGVMSMARGFIAAGTKGVISGLWKVNDESSANIMTLYYKILKTEKNSRNALKLAKLAWLNDSKNSTLQNLPYYWDSLNYSGDDIDIQLEEKKLPWLPYLFFGFFGFVIIIAIIRKIFF